MERQPLATIWKLSAACLAWAVLIAVAQGGDAGSKWNLKSDRILFLGNSITLHGPAPAIGWLGNWGMAASSEEKDYVHLLTSSIARLSGKRPEIQVANIADFERNYEAYDRARFKKHFDFKADIVVVAIGENVPALVTDRGILTETPAILAFVAQSFPAARLAPAIRRLISISLQKRVG